MEGPADDADMLEQLCRDLNQAHDEICELQGIKDPSLHDWPEWTPQANSIRWVERRLGRKMAKTDQWTLFPTGEGSREEGPDGCSRGTTSTA